jgi:uncharacterized repeat protein (TIGR03809 family)
MPHSFPRKSFVDVARRWLLLAEKRRAHLIELYDSGRWRHYYTEAQLLAHTREAIMLEETWAKLVYPDGLPPAQPAPKRVPLPSIAQPAMTELRTRLERFRRAG